MSRGTAPAQDLSTWQNLFETLAPILPGDAAVRRRNFEAFLASGFPTKRQEVWKYMDLSALAGKTFAVADADEQLELPDFAPLPDAEAVVFVNGQCVDGNERSRQVEAVAAPQHDSVTALNGALSAQGLDLRLEANQSLARPLHVISYRSAGSTRSTSHLRHRIELQDNAEATVIMESRGSGEYLGTELTKIKLGTGARLYLYRLQDTAGDASELDKSLVEIGRDARLVAFNVDLGLGLARHDFDVALAAPGADMRLQALSLTGQRAHVDNHVRIEHQAPHGRSRIDYRGIAGGHSRLIFDGLVVVAKGAVKTDSNQRLATLLLSPAAEVNAKPELEIYNDDVRCNHGAATGQLDTAALFYMRSRGVDEARARQLLTLAFVSTLLDAVALPALREHLQQRVGARVEQLLADGATSGGAA